MGAVHINGVGTMTEGCPGSGALRQKGSQLGLPGVIGLGRNSSEYDNSIEYGNSTEYSNSSEYDNSIEYGNSTEYSNSSEYDNSIEYGNSTEYSNSSAYDNSIEYGNSKQPYSVLLFSIQNIHIVLRKLLSEV
ncbi:hypothetical protein CDAR_394281 [Caerostris darwini]|uniref:Uncharacterized protein n=1 Tax=Caerostris darwini TaxID=1538125 RepID=A0AAV4REM3_9ARAC|nr:hypothetical protein CDAR_394281 [Caerostris darwini]